ncbi:MAG: EAL domain-containing protein [Polyangiaceae bacterium]|nr:EAL domain-containing protein [Polyangiaceae bacterium]
MWSRHMGEPVRVGVNISARQIEAPEFFDMVEQTQADFHLPPSHLELEVTESIMMADLERATTVLQKLRNLGVRVGIDDFGTGYSSLGQLKRLPIDTLKIDRSFIKDLPGDRADASIATAVVHLAKKLGLEVVAEGVETQEQLDFLEAPTRGRHEHLAGTTPGTERLHFGCLKQTPHARL